MIPCFFEEELLAEIVILDHDQVQINPIDKYSNKNPKRLYLKAIIDRIDIDENHKLFGIIDYKLRSSKCCS